MPTFSIYTFSSEKVGGKWYLVVSKKWTWVNIVLTYLGLAAGILFMYSRNHRIFQNYIVFTPCHLITLIAYLILMYSKCGCCKDFTKRSGLDIETLEVKDLDELTKNEFELQSLNNLPKFQHESAKKCEKIKRKDYFNNYFDLQGF